MKTNPPFLPPPTRAAKWHQQRGRKNPGGIYASAGADGTSILKKSGKLEEAAGYYHIGKGKLRTLVDTHPNEEFYMMNGNRVLIKREKFERYLDQATAV